MLDYRRTHDCGSLRKHLIESQVILSGWVHRRRDHGGLIFVDLRDRHGITQIVFDPKKNAEAHKAAESLRQEWVITVHGTVIARGEGMANPNMETGEIEVEVQTLGILSRARTPPFSISEDTLNVNEELRLEYRYLDIRRGTILRNLQLRHRCCMAARQYLDAHGFLEVTTPILAKSTPEGARDYLVPSRVHPGSFYALPQSPQLFKQLLMISSVDRYFQICSCFRDEDLRSDRQPEFSQIDMEMSFGTPEELIGLVEGMVKAVFLTTLNLDIEAPFTRISHKEAIDRFGTDRPDLRFGMELFTLTDLASESDFTIFQEAIKNGCIVKGLCIKGGADLSRRLIEQYTSFVEKLGIRGLAWMKMQEGMLHSSIVKYFNETLQRNLIERAGMEEGDLIFMIADQPARTNQALDHLRRTLASDRGLIPVDTYAFVWVGDFPLFCYNEEEGRLQSEHHPFTAPHPDDIALLETDPLKVRSLGYDIVLNGYELGGGSQRIHDTALQKKIFEILALTPEEIQAKFGFFIDALSYGTPPHLGIALGLDRLVMLLAGTDNIRDVIAFPKTQKASDLMLDCPSEVSAKQLKELQIQLEIMEKGGKLPC